MAKCTISAEIKRGRSEGGGRRERDKDQMLASYVK